MHEENAPPERQLLEALGPETAIRGSHQSDDLFPGSSTVVTGVLQLARYPNGSDYNSCAAGRHRRDDPHSFTRRSPLCLALGAIPDPGGLRDHDQRWRHGHEPVVKLACGHRPS
jgi:hypothetical protein